MILHRATGMNIHSSHRWTERATPYTPAPPAGPGAGGSGGSGPGPRGPSPRPGPREPGPAPRRVGARPAAGGQRREAILAAALLELFVERGFPRPPAVARGSAGPAPGRRRRHHLPLLRLEGGPLGQRPLSAPRKGRDLAARMLADPSPVAAGAREQFRAPCGGGCPTTSTEHPAGLRPFLELHKTTPSYLDATSRRALEERILTFGIKLRRDRPSARGRASPSGPAAAADRHTCSAPFVGPWWSKAQASAALALDQGRVGHRRASACGRRSAF